ncbi:MAG: LPS-assembly protein LptD [Acidobacteriaceae bacterium]
MLNFVPAMKLRWFWFITLLTVCHPQLLAQVVTTQLPPAKEAATTLPEAPSPETRLPVAQVVPQPLPGTPVRMQYERLQVLRVPHGNEYVLTGHIVLFYRDYIVHADKATYNSATGEVVAQGHLMVDGGPDDEHILADHGRLNVKNNTADFFDVTGTLGVRKVSGHKAVFTSQNPYVVTGKEVQQLGKGHYRVVDGTMTACRLPKPDWRFYARHIELNDGKASAANANFRLFGVPILWVPYVKHEIRNLRTSGILLPVAGNNSTYGAVVGDSVYVTLGRSADLVAGSLYYAKRGWAPFATFRYRGVGDNYGQIRFRSLLDRHTGTNNLGGVDFIADGRYDFSKYTRAVIDSEYLSSYRYRLTFEQNYTAATNSEVKSQLYVEHEQDGFVEAIHFNRYQNIQNVNPTGNEVRILHLPQVDLTAEDHRLRGTPIEWGYAASAGALSRYDYNPFGTAFRTGSEIPRVDLRPWLNVPLHGGGWNFRPELSVRDTWYGKSQHATGLNHFPVLRGESINRMDVETGFTLRPPVVGRDFDSAWVRRMFGGDLRHTIAPSIRYRYVTGINNFRKILRFDDTDIASDTNEMEYGLTQRLYLRNRKPHGCKGAASLGPKKECGGGTLDWMSLRVAQKYYFNSTFGGAVTKGTPNPLLATLDFTGVDFLTSPRDYSPVISRLRVNTGSGASAEWDLDYDTKAGHITSSNVYADYRKGNYRLKAGDAYLDTVIGVPPGTVSTAANPTNKPTPYNQLNLSAIYGSSARRGFSAGGATGIDLQRGDVQYSAVQAMYNWNCCGFTVEVRHFSLANIRNDTEELFSFTLAGFGSTGIPRSARIF